MKTAGSSVINPLPCVVVCERVKIVGMFVCVLVSTQNHFELHAISHVFGLPNFSDSCQERSTIISFCF